MKTVVLVDDEQRMLDLLELYINLTAIHAGRRNLDMKSFVLKGKHADLVF